MKKNKTVIKRAKHVRNYKLILHIKAKKIPLYTLLYTYFFKKAFTTSHEIFFTKNTFKNVKKFIKLFNAPA